MTAYFCDDCEKMSSNFLEFVSDSMKNISNIDGIHRAFLVDQSKKFDPNSGIRSTDSAPSPLPVVDYRVAVILFIVCVVALTARWKQIKEKVNIVPYFHHPPEVNSYQGKNCSGERDLVQRYNISDSVSGEFEVFPEKSDNLLCSTKPCYEETDSNISDITKTDTCGVLDMKTKSKFIQKPGDSLISRATCCVESNSTICDIVRTDTRVFEVEKKSTFSQKPGNTSTVLLHSNILEGAQVLRRSSPNLDNLSVENGKVSENLSVGCNVRSLRRATVRHETNSQKKAQKDRYITPTTNRSIQDSPACKDISEQKCERLQYDVYGKVIDQYLCESYNALHFPNGRENDTHSQDKEKATINYAGNMPPLRQCVTDSLSTGLSQGVGEKDSTDLRSVLSGDSLSSYSFSEEDSIRSSELKNPFSMLEPTGDAQGEISDISNSSTM